MLKRGSSFKRLSTDLKQILSVGAVATAITLAPAMAKAQLVQPQDVSGIKAPAGYALHGSFSFGGNKTNIVGSDAMYDTLVNIHDGPRAMGENLILHPLASNKHPLFDEMTVFSNGFGGDPFNFATMNLYKGKWYQFTGTFRRDRQYFDYDLLGNPNIPSGQQVPIGPVQNPTGSFSYPQVKQSPFLYNTVRRMTDVNLRVLPLSSLSYRFEYSQNVMEGPSLSPGGAGIEGDTFNPGLGRYNQLLEAYQRNSSDDFQGEIDWKPVENTTLTYEEIVDHVKEDTSYTIAPNQFTAQEADGTPVAPGRWDSLQPPVYQVPPAAGPNFNPYSLASYCNAGSMGAGYTGPNNYTVYSAPMAGSNRPIINPACFAATSYLRSQPTRMIFPTEIFRFESTSIHNIQMNGDVRYTYAKMNLPHFYENFQGLTGAVTYPIPEGRARQVITLGSAKAKREAIAADYGIVWNVSPNFVLTEQAVYSNVAQPGNVLAGPSTLYNTTSDPNATINYSGPLTTSTADEEGGSNGQRVYNYFGQQHYTNNASVAWYGLPKMTFTVTYRYSFHKIAQGNPHNQDLALGQNDNGTVTIHNNGGILNVDFRPTQNWYVSGSAEAMFADNAFTPVSPRREQHYQVHTLDHIRPWLTINGLYNDREVRNNTNNNQAAVAAGLATYNGPIDHVAYTRTGSVGAEVAPSTLYQVTANYTYSQVYTSTNICYMAGAMNGLPGASSPSGVACKGPDAAETHANPGHYEIGPVKDYELSPTQTGYVALSVHPYRTIHTQFGYTISSTSGSRFYNDARDVAGSLVSTYQSPDAEVSWNILPGWEWSAKYRYYGYGEGGPSGAKYCTMSDPTENTPANVVPCSSLPQTGQTLSSAGETDPRNFHANIVTVGMHYEF